MIPRDITNHLQKLFSKYPVITLTGPRQSGKSMLVKSVFPDLPYISFEDPEIRRVALHDTKTFLKAYSKGAVFDEAQYIPDLFSYLQLITDEANKPGMFVLTGSQNFLLLEKISQSLAGRTAVLHLMPFSLHELQTANELGDEPFKLIQRGFYPRMFDYALSPEEFYPYYVQTYLERDVRSLSGVVDMLEFSRFLSLCAGRVSQPLNKNNLAADAGISVPTLNKWLSILQASFLIYLLPPYYKNYNKRLTRQPKLYFTDTGLLNWYLGIHSGKSLENHYLKGEIFENFVIQEHLKKIRHSGKPENMWFWRDNNGREIDLIIEREGNTYAYEIKSAATFNHRFFKSLEYWRQISGNSAINTGVIYAGNQQLNSPNGQIIPWWKI